MYNIFYSIIRNNKFIKFCLYLYKSYIYLILYKIHIRLYINFRIFYNIISINIFEYLNKTNNRDEKDIQIKYEYRLSYYVSYQI
jgi:hypothetical protein